MTEFLVNKMLFFADPHFGVNYPHNRDPETGISVRAHDVIDHFNTIIETAKNEGIHYIFCAGDFYNRISGVNPTIKRELRTGPLKDLLAAGIELRIISGNHDAPASQKRGCDLEDLSIYPNIKIYRRVSSEVIEISNQSVAIVYLPYFSVDALVDNYQNMHPDVQLDPGNRAIYATEMISQLIEQRLQDPAVQAADTKILIGHYAISDAQASKSRKYNLLPNDLILKQEEYHAKEFALCAFGHIHKGQDLHNIAPEGTEIVMLGSIDYVDWGEVFDGKSKGFYSYDVTEKTLNYHAIPCRESYFNKYIIPDEEEDVEKAIRNHLEKLNVTNPAEAEIRVEVEVPAGKGKQVPHDILKQVFPDAFYTWFIFKERLEGIGSLAPREEVLEPRLLFDEFCDELPYDKDQIEVIKQEGEKLIAEVEEEDTETGVAEDVWIESVEMENFNKYRSPQSITFDKQTIAIAGPTGSGKTSIFDAIVFCIFGDSGLSRVDTIKEAFGENGGKVTLIFRQGDKTWRITRGIKKGPKGGLSTFAELVFGTQDGKWNVYKGGIGAISTKLGEIFGVNWEGFKNSVFIPQGEIKNFSKSGSKVIKVLTRLFHLDIFETLKGQADVKIKELTQEIDQSTGGVDTLQAEVDTLPDLEQELVELKENISQIEQQVEEAQANLDVAEAELEVLEPLRDQFSKTEQLLVDKRNQRDKLTLEINLLRESQTEYQAKLEEMEKLGTNPREELLRRQNDRAAIQHDLDTRSLLDAQEQDSKTRFNTEKTAIDNKIEQKTSAIKDEEDKRTNIPANFDRDAAFDYLRSEGRFNERIERIENIEISLAQRLEDDSVISSLTEEETNAKTELINIQEQTEHITPDYFALTEINNKITELQRETEELNTEREALVKRRVTERSAIREEFSKLDPDLIQKCDALETEIREIKVTVQTFENLETFFAQNQDPSPLIDEKTKAVMSINDEITAVTTELETLNEEMEKYKVAAQKVKALRENKEGLSNQMEKARATVEFKEGRIAEVQQKVQQIEDLEAQVVDARNLLNVFEILKDNIFHPKGIPQYAINKLAGPLGLQAGEFLERLTGGRYSQVKLEPIVEKANRYGFKVSVFDSDKGWRPVESFSGGEQTQINAALRFAVSKEVLGLKYNAPRFLFIDEGDLGSLDADDARRDFVNVLIELGQNYKQLVLITHFPEVAEPFEAQYFVTIEDGASKIRRQA